MHTAIHPLKYTFPHLHTSCLGDYPEGKSKHLTMHRKTVLSKASRIGDLSSSRTPKSILLTDVGFLALGATNTTDSQIEPLAASLYNEIFELKLRTIINLDHHHFHLSLLNTRSTSNRRLESTSNTIFGATNNTDCNWISLVFTCVSFGIGVALSSHKVLALILSLKHSIEAITKLSVVVCTMATMQQIRALVSNIIKHLLQCHCNSPCHVTFSGIYLTTEPVKIKIIQSDQQLV